MKNGYLKKHDLFKLASIFLLIAVLLSWLFKLSYFQNGEITIEEDLTRVGLFDLPVYTLESFRYYYKTFLLIFAIGAYYRVLNGVEAYRALLDSFARLLKGKEKIFVAISIILYAVLASIFTNYLVLLAFAPFTIAVASRLKVDKITGFVSSFGGILLGVLASTYGTRIVGQVASSGSSSGALGVGYAYELIGVVVIGILAYLALLLLTFMRMDRKVKDSVVDPFANEVIEKPELKADVKKSKKVKKSPKINLWPISIILGVFGLVLVLAFINWESGFNISFFSDITTSFLGDGGENVGATLFGLPVYHFILGQSLTAFGSWDEYSLITLMLLTLLIIKIVYRVRMDDILENAGEGAKKAVNYNALLLVILAVLLVSVIYPTLPQLMGKIMGNGKNIFTLYISGLISSAFTVDFVYTIALIGSGFTALGNNTIAALTLQSTFGVVGFIAPTSIVLMLGLSMMDIKYKDYFKFIWKFLIAILIITLVVINVLLHVQ